MLVSPVGQSQRMALWLCRGLRMVHLGTTPTEQISAMRVVSPIPG
jgi:hypothetical protein